jgi:hypothetical protein
MTSACALIPARALGLAFSLLIAIVAVSVNRRDGMTHPHA